MFDPLRAARAAGNAYTSALNAGLRYMPDFGATVRDGLKMILKKGCRYMTLIFS